MDKEQEIKEIENEQRKLADRLKALQEPEVRVGDVWAYGTAGHLKLLVVESGNILLDTGLLDRKGAGSRGYWSHGQIAENATRLGTFDEVYVLRSKVDDTFEAKVRAFRDSKGKGMDDYYADEDEVADFMFELLNETLDE